MNLRPINRSRLIRAVSKAIAVCLIVAIWPKLSQAEQTTVSQYDRGVPYITLRDRTGSSDPKDFYGQERSDLKSGWCTVDQVGLDFLAPAADLAPFRIPDEIIRVESVTETTRDALWRQLRITADGRPPALYVHGFFIDFEKGCRRATVFKENASLGDVFMWFSWPSDGNLLNYARDEVDLYWSVPDLADVIVEMQKEFGRGDVNLIGHSLGARGLVLALYDLTSKNPAVRVDNVVLLAPDMDYGIFRKLLPRISTLAGRVTVYTAPYDRPLALSAQLHGYPRLGQSGNDTLALIGVEVIDIAELSRSSPSGHLYHLYSEEVGDDLEQLLVKGKGAADRSGLTRVGENLWIIENRD